MPARRILVIANLLVALLVSSCAASRNTSGETRRANAQPSGGGSMPPLVPSAPVPLADSDQIPVGNAPMLGNADALVTIVEFGDFECPFCARAESTLAELRQRFPRDVRIVWRNRPLPFHPHARLAAEAAFAARAQGKFWEMHDLLYQHHDRPQALERSDLERYAEELQLDMPRFRSDLDQHSFASAVDEDIALAERLDADGVPHFFINGTRFVGARPIEQFAAAVDRALAAARGYPPGRAYADGVRDALARRDQYPPTEGVPARPSAPVGELDPTTVYRVPVGDSPVTGAADALVTVVLFSDFQCPFCARVEPTVAALMDHYRGDIRLVWKHDPLPFHDHAMQAAEASQEVYRQLGATAFWRFRDELFRNQRALDRRSLEQYAQSVQVDSNAFRSALDQHTHARRIREDVDLAEALDARGTPTFFVNGRRFVGAQPLDRFVAFVDERLAEARDLVAHGVARGEVYARLTANGATQPVRLPGTPDPPRDNHAGARVFTVRPNPRAPWRGAANATVVLEHFSDFECPFCSRIDPTLQQVLRAYGTRVRIVWRDYPLSFHAHAAMTAEAAREVFAQRGNDAFWRFHDLVFQNQRALERADLERYAQSVGVNLARFRSALDHHTHEQGIRDDVSAADATGLGIGTPTTFVNGHAIVGAQPFAEFQRVIEAELDRPTQR
jgi:protein-disulfide isomerase